MKPSLRDDGFTLIETLVAISLFAIVSVSFYSVLLATIGVSETSHDVVRISEDARLGLNRMIRDTREGQSLASLSPTSYQVDIDFDGDGLTGLSSENPNGNGDYEELTFKYVGSDDSITLNEEVLAAGVEPIDSQPIFSYTSNDLTYDWNGDGVTTQPELDAASSHGYPAIDGSDSGLYTSVVFAFRVRSGDRVTDFRGQAQLRNRR
jgi:prepilin-type N-terminal cleavage/methylation domain-containing protein